MKTFLKIVLTLAILAGLGYGGWWAYNQYFAEAPKEGTVYVQSVSAITGVGPAGRAPFREFERAILTLQITWEEAFEHVAETMEGTAPVLILCDRGIPEIAAYMEQDQYLQILHDAGLTAESAKETYDAAIHLVSVVDGAPDLYTTDNNEQRYETPEIALRQELRIRECWDGYARRSVIRAEATDFAGKMAAATAVLVKVLEEADDRHQGAD